MEGAASQIWRFGAVEIDDRASAIKVAGENIALDQSSRAILLALLRRAGEPVSKDELLRAGWPGRIVHENSLAKAVGRLRKSLGPDGRSLEAVYGAGYRLAVEAECVPAPATAAAHLRTPPWRAAALAGAGVLSLGAILVAATLLGKAPDTDERRLRIGEAHDVIGRVLWVDDHPENNAVEKRAFEEQRIAVYSVRSTEEALMLLSMYDYDAVISDMGRGEEPLAGLKLVQEMREREDRTPFYLYTILTSHAQRDLLARHGGQGAAEAPEELYAFILPLFESKLAGR